MGIQKSTDYYDEIYGASAEYTKHFTESVYYPSWTSIIHYLKRHATTRIVDLGCGPGQFAQLCRYYFPNVPYLGVDFSATAIEQARERAPDAEFLVADLSGELPFKQAAGQTIVALEFLEHVDFDVELIASLPEGTCFIGSVPNFDWESHVRHFESAGAVAQRYAGYFGQFEVQDVLLNKAGTCLHVFTGVRLPNG